MTQGKSRQARELVAAQAVLVWLAFTGDEARIQEYVETGRLDGKEDIIPYDPDLLKAIVGTGKVA